MAHEFLNLALSIPDAGSVFLTVFGIGLVIFVHEAGHFLCARLCGVDVEVFSLGFGPRLFGFVRNGTDYRVSLVPVGGYVKMLGDQPGEGGSDPRALNSKSVGQRFLVYSGGVLMNVVFALIAFPLLFAAGVPLERPTVGAVTPGSPAWLAGLREGDEVLAVNGRPVLGFTDITLEVALSDPDDTSVRILRDGEEHLVQVRPEYSEALGTLSLGIRQRRSYAMQVESGGAAERAGLRSGDVLVEIDGQPASERAMARLDPPDEDGVRLAVLRGSERHEVVLVPDWETTEQAILGILPHQNVVVGLRGRFAAGGPLRKGDAVLRVGEQRVVDASTIEQALGSVPTGQPIDLTVLRDGQEQHLELQAALVDRLVEDVAFSMRPDEEWMEAVPITVMPGSAAAEAGLTDAMRVLSLNGARVQRWSELQNEVAEADGAPIDALVQLPSGETREIRVKPRPRQAPDWGFLFEVDTVVRRYGMPEAVQVGLYSSWNLARQAYLTLRKMVSRQVSTRNLGGPVAITTVSYHFAKSGLAKLFYFLALLSINLAVVNLLPIPILDGGHLLFLIIEKVKGSPVNDRVMGYSQVFGLVVILSLLIYVTFNDIRRLFE